MTTPGAPEQLSRDEVLAQLRPLLEDESKGKLGQHLKYDANVLMNHGITLRGIREDTMLESYVLDATGSRHDLDTLALKYLGQRTIHFEDIAGKGAKQITFNQVPDRTSSALCGGGCRGDLAVACTVVRPLRGGAVSSAVVPRAGGAARARAVSYRAKRCVGLSRATGGAKCRAGPANAGARG